MAIDIFNPEVSQVVKGLKGKLVFIYGTNSTGKTKNLVKGEKPLVAAFESGLNAIGGVANIKINKWKDWTDFVKQLTNSQTIEKARETYSTIIIDTAEGMANLASTFVAMANGVSKIQDGNKGYGLWKEYSAEIDKYLKLLTNAGYTVFFIAHEGEREFYKPDGEKYTKIYPKGDKRVIDPICDLCDIIGYARIQPDNEKGEEVLSTLYLKGNPAFHARSRFTYIVSKIEEWSYDKFEKALIAGIEKEEKNSKNKAISLEDYQKQEQKKKEEQEKNKLPIEVLIERIGEMVNDMINQEGNMDNYEDIKEKALGTKNFQAEKATEAQREHLELLYEALIERGYVFEE